MDNELKELLEGFKNEILDSMNLKLDEKLKGIKEDIQMINIKLDRNTEKVDDIGLDLKVVERNVRRDIRKLSDENETIIEVLKIHEILPQ